MKRKFIFGSVLILVIIGLAIAVFAAPDKGVTQDEITSLPEIPVIKEHTGNDDYQYDIVTDNSGNRIMFLLDENSEKQFKTIFIKNESRLKIIDLDAGQIFNEII